MTAPGTLEIDYYLERVAAALADLPQDVRDDLMEDLPAHFAEVLQEQGGSLVERLGPPAVYAAELRAAAGLEPGAPAPTRGGVDLDRIRARLRTADERTGRIIGYERATEFLRLLSPAWWIARAVCIVVLIFALDIIPTDRFDDPLGWAVLAVAVVVSVRIGATGRPRAPRWVGFAATAVAVLGALFVLANTDGLLYRFTGHYSSGEGTSYIDRYSNVTDVYPVDENGKPLENITLYDQDGNPIELGEFWRCATDGTGRPAPAYPLCRGPRPGATNASPTPGISPSASAPASPSVSPSPSASVSPAPSR